MPSPRVPLVVGDREVLISSPQRLVFADVTKLQLAQYYAQVAGPLFTALKQRPTTLERWPDGVRPGMKLGEDGFYSKRLPKGAPDWVRGVEITFPSGRTAVQVCPTESAVAVWAAQMGTITFHPWPVRSADVDRPDQLRFDLDPTAGLTFSDAVRVAGYVRQLLEELGLTAFVKTSGGRGVHVFAPIEPRWDFIEVRHAVIALAREVERRHRDQVTTNWWKEERGQRVFIDFNQAARDRTMASAYSVRANAGATVSTPVRWEELEQVHPEQFTVFSVPARLADQGDPWADMSQFSGSIETLLQWWERDVAVGLGELPYPPDYPKMPGEPPRVAPSRARHG